MFYDAGFSDLARSHAFVCTIAAFFESLFKLWLPFIGVFHRGKLDSAHRRVQRFSKSPKNFWNPQKPMHKKDGSGIVDRVVDILTGAQILDQFPADVEPVMRAVFAYRNAMVHNGYEWPLKERQTFEARMLSEGWSDWFSVARSGEEPWFFTITQAFRDACLNTCKESTSTLAQLSGLD